MADLSKRLRDLLSPPHADDWCDTTRLANPWEVLLGGLRRRRAEPKETVDQPPPDLREVDQPAGKDAPP
jgi:hypothetical protein